MSNSIILKITCKYPEIFSGIGKIISYLNELYRNFSVPFFIETIDNGFLIIFKDFQTFKKFRDYELLEEKLKQLKKKKANSHNYIKEFFDIHKFPSNGLKIIVEIGSIYLNDVYKILEDNFHQVHKEISVNLEENDCIVVIFKNLESICLYSEVLLSFTKELEENYNAS